MQAPRPQPRTDPLRGGSGRADTAAAVAFGPPPDARPSEAAGARDASSREARAESNGVPLRRLKSHLFVEPGDGDAVLTYAIVDGANAPELLDHLYDQCPTFACLYSGTLSPDMAEVAPYLVQLEPNHPFTKWLLAEGWGRSWCVFAHAAADLARLRRHLRTFLMVYDPDGKPLYFRYYDPRVLRAYLPTCNAEETQTVFGPVAAYLMEDAEPAVLLRFAPQGALPVQESLVLRSDARATPRAADGKAS